MLITVATPLHAGDRLGDVPGQTIHRMVETVPNAVSPATASTGYASAGNRAQLESGEIFYADYIVEYWKQRGAHGGGESEAANVPGHVVTKPVFGGIRQQAGVPDMRRKLEAVLIQMLAHPALRDARGVSLMPRGGFGHEKGGPMGAAVAGRVSLHAYPIRLNDPKTVQFKDGTYHTRVGEGDSIVVGVNDTDVLEGRTPIGTYHGVTVLARGGGYLLLVPNTDRSLFIAEETASGPRRIINPNLIDPSRPASDIQFLTVYVATASSTWSAIAHGKQNPVSGVGRLLGVMFNSDWPALLRQLNGAD